MKKTVLILFATVFGMSLSQAQNHEMSPNVQFSKIVNRSADYMWEKVRKLDEIHKYSSVIVSVDWSGNMGVGGERVCHFPEGQGYVKEKFLAYDESSRSFTYSVIEGAIPVKGMTNTLQVVDLGYGKCILAWWSHYDQFIENPQVTEEQFHASIISSLEEMTARMAMD